MSAAAAAGYAHAGYAASLAPWGTPVPLPRSGGWLLRRAIAGSDRADLAGCYPLTCCADWRELRADLAAQADDAVAVVLVADPFGNHTPQLLADTFDHAVAWKDHYIADLGADPRLPRPHRRNVQLARERVQVQRCDPQAQLDAWCELYAQLCRRHAITGLRAFSREAFARQFEVPGLVAFQATVDAELVGLHLWFEQGEVAYGHLGATSELGHATMAAYALYDHARDFFRPRVRWLDLGAGAGSAANGDDGLVRFKRGWATGTRPAYLCTRVLDAPAYAALAAAHPPTSFFPAYRAGE